MGILAYLTLKKKFKPFSVLAASNIIGALSRLVTERADGTLMMLSLLIQKDVIYFLHRLSHYLIRLNFKELLFSFHSLGTKMYMMPYMVPTPSHLPTYLPPPSPSHLLK